VKQLRSIYEVEAPHDTVLADIDLYAKPAHLAAFKGISAFNRAVAPDLGVDIGLAEGVGDYLLRRYPGGKVTRRQAADLSIEALLTLREISSQPPLKARSFNYLPLDASEHIATQVQTAVTNAEYMCNIFGSSIFTGSGEHDGSYYRAPLGKGFSLTAKGGSGAGAFALDVAIEVDKYGDDRDRKAPSHELWRVGLDTAELIMHDSTITTGRIIRTGGAVKPTDEWKKAQFDRFTKEFRSAPQRILTFTAAHIMQALGINTGLALSTFGARELSSLRRSCSGVPTRYTELHQGMGFNSTYNAYWHMVPKLATEFYDRLVSTECSTPGLKRHEFRVADMAIDAFNQLKNYPNNRSFPLRLCVEDDTATVESALRSQMGRTVSRGY
jgi:hypothetical protein